MAKFKSIAALLRRFTLNQKGTTAVTFALSVVPLLLAGGAAVDYIRYSDAETKLQAALDAGALTAAASPGNSASAKAKSGKDAFEANLKSLNIDPRAVESNFTVNGTRISASARYPMDAGFMQIAGLSKMVVDVEAEINSGDGKKAEIALVLDYSGSMEEVSGGQVKYVAMKNAAKKLVTDLEASNPKKFKIGLVPFSHHVYVTLPKKYVLGQTGPGTWTGCTQDRRYPYNLTDATPIDDNNGSKWGQPIAKVHEADGCDAYVPKNLKVAPLTNDFTALRSQLDAMRPYAWTHIALGAEFGYHLLSPNEPFGQGADYGDTRVKKMMVILTDGRQTEPAFGDGVRNINQGGANLEAICTNAKASGITVVTVAFDLRDKETRKRLRDCATDPDKNFFIAEDSTDIAGVFESIKNQVAAQLYISR